VTRFGMSELGLLSLEGQSQEVFLGRDLMTRSEYSDRIAGMIDAQVRRIVFHCYEETLQLIQENRVVIDRLVDLLIERETIDGDEFRQIVAEYVTVPEKERFVPVL
jgi:cell division protease FtsH